MEWGAQRTPRSLTAGGGSGQPANQRAGVLPQARWMGDRIEPRQPGPNRVYWFRVAGPLGFAYLEDSPRIGLDVSSCCDEER